MASQSKKTKIALIDLTSCTGCEVNLLRLGSRFLELAEHFEIADWHMLQRDKDTDYDVVFVEGFVCNEEQERLLRQARRTSQVLVALGACAMTGNVFSQIKPEKYEWLKSRVYPPEYQPVTHFVKPVSQVVEVDHVIPGCPASSEAAARLFEELTKRPIRSPRLKVREPDFVSRIEGHGKLEVDLEKGHAVFAPVEGERFVEALAVGRPYWSAPKLHSRICGICPAAHTLCAIEASERALDIRPSTQTILLRRLFQCGQMVSSHLMHLYLMVLPSIANFDSSVDFSLVYPEEFKIFLEIKRIAEEITDAIGGAPLHAVTPEPGGFTRVPDAKRLSQLGRRIEKVLEDSLDLVRILGTFRWAEAETVAHMLCVKPVKDEYPFYGISLIRNGPEPVSSRDYLYLIEEHTLKGQSGKVAYLKGKRPVKTGALSRIFRFNRHLNPLASVIFKELGINFQNPFHNNLSQAVELIHYLEEAGKLLAELGKGDVSEAKIDEKKVRQRALSGKGPWPRRGVGLIEAPRGILIHDVEIDKSGLVTNYNIITPTALNLSALAPEAELFLLKNPNLPREKKRTVLEDLVRASDPCITCAVH